MTTDTVHEEIAVTFTAGGKTITLGGMSKGSGMIHPNMCTMLGFLTTDLAIEKSLLQEALSEVVTDTFNMITVDGDTSTNDTLILMANGLAGNAKITAKGEDYDNFLKALFYVCEFLAKKMAADGEGATKFVTVKVVNARTTCDAKLAAEAVANSLLCKTAWFGNDPNWGRIAAALGYSGAVFDPDKCDIDIDGVPVMTQGGDAGTPEAVAAEKVRKPEFTIRCNFNDGDSNYWVWSSDVSYEYVKINADYHT